MKNFENVIGYDAIKKEMMQVCDMLKNPEIYEKLGAKLPSGILLYGEPGLGKTLLAKSFIAECNLKTFTVRKTRSDDFADFITETFQKAKESAPSIVFLDDMDKFANEDSSHQDADEYVAVQAGIDEVKGSGVFVLATVNEIGKLPRSLRRSGRFDKRIELEAPGFEDSKKIITHYLKDKNLSDDINLDDIAKMISYSSCAELETILNQAAILAGYKRKEQIEMPEFVSAVLNTEDFSRDLAKASDDQLRKVAVHEAGHLIMADILRPESIGLAALITNDDGAVSGFVRRCKKLLKDEHHILVSLAGKAAVETLYGYCADGCSSDIERACELIRDRISEDGTMGFGMIDVTNHRFPKTSESLNSRNESVVHAELERYMYMAKEIIANNREYLEKAAKALFEKRTLLASDISALRENIAKAS